ncbi:hypothetical protein QUB37_29390 [Microcoleus sp. AT3-A2]|uniref:hypothetical protein n=1 Tax=Microcoleus sp. AT3-A2 TaxID=2818610 RepID=UPI002FD1EF2F
MHLKLFVLSASSVALWIAPLAALDKTLDIHKALQGVSLGAAIACAVTAGNIARKQAEQDEIEEIKTRAIKADIVDEISTSAYVSQTQRQQEAEQILNGEGECSEDVQRLERALALKYNEDEPNCSEHPKQLAESEQNGTSNEDVQRAERILELRTKGWGKLKIILEIWGLTRGGGSKYKAAEAEYHRVIDGVENA